MDQPSPINENLSNTACGTSGPFPSGAKPKKPQLGRPRKREENSREDLLDSSTTVYLPRNVTKQNDLLESMRLMINKTVDDAINSSNYMVCDEIHSLQATVDSTVGEIHYLKNSFNT